MPSCPFYLTDLYRHAAFVSSVVSVYFVPHDKHFVTLIAVGIAEGASILALAIDLAFFLLVKEKMRTLEVEAITNLGPGSSTHPPLALSSSIPSGTYMAILLFSPRSF